jgi:hypothetical protein
MSKWTFYRDWEALPGEFRYKAVQFLDLNATDEELESAFLLSCKKRGYRVSKSGVDSFIASAFDKWGMAVGPVPAA